MRTLLFLSVIVLAAGTTGCARGPCGESWRPGYYLFGYGRQNYRQYQQYQTGAECCDPCGGSGGSYMESGAMMTPGTVVTQAPCCQ